MTQDAPPSLTSLTQTFGKIAALSFGGPAGQIALMHKILVEQKRWISEARFIHALNFCLLLPGPEAQQLATYCGWRLHGTVGGLIAGGLFILPGVVVLMALSMIYAEFGHVGSVASAFFGLKAAVLAIVLQALIKISARTLQNTPMRLLAFAAFIALYFFALPFPFVIAAAAIIGLAGQYFGISAFLKPIEAPHHTEREWQTPSLKTTLQTASFWLLLWLLPTLILFIALGGNHIFTILAVFFSKIAVITFGGAYAILAYVAQAAVSDYHWLTAPEVADGLGMAETTPGPLIMVLQFVGFIAAFRAPLSLPPLIAGALGGFITTYVTFVPCFLWIFTLAPYSEALYGNRHITAALTAIRASVVGVIVNLTLWFATHTLFTKTDHINSFGLWFDWPSLTSLNIPMLCLAGLAGMLLYTLRLGAMPTLVITCFVSMGLFYSKVLI